jgi:hypothetical protein
LELSRSSIQITKPWETPALRHQSGLKIFTQYPSSVSPQTGEAGEFSRPATAALKRYNLEALPASSKISEAWPRVFFFGELLKKFNLTPLTF